MSKRYPPIFNVILFAVAVIFMLLNPISNMVPWPPEAIKTAVAAAIVEDNKEHNERTFANVLYPFTATVGITFIMPALLISLR